MKGRAIVFSGAIALSTLTTFLEPASAASTPAAAHTARDDGGLTQRTRWLLAMVIVDLAVAAWWRGWLNPGAGRRGMTLGEDPQAQPPEARPREGHPPSLR